MAALSSFAHDLVRKPVPTFRDQAPLPCSPGREAPRTLRERLECSEGGNTGRRTRKPYRARRSVCAAVRSAPGRGRAETGLIRGLSRKARPHQTAFRQTTPGPLCCLPGTGDRLDISALAVFFEPALRA